MYLPAEDFPTGRGAAQTWKSMNAPTLEFLTGDCKNLLTFHPAILACNQCLAQYYWRHFFRLGRDEQFRLKSMEEARTVRMTRLDVSREG